MVDDRGHALDEWLTREARRNIVECPNTAEAIWLDGEDSVLLHPIIVSHVHATGMSRC